MEVKLSSKVGKFFCNPNEQIKTDKDMIEFHDWANPTVKEVGKFLTKAMLRFSSREKDTSEFKKHLKKKATSLAIDVFIDPQREEILDYLDDYYEKPRVQNILRFCYTVEIMRSLKKFLEDLVYMQEAPRQRTSRERRRLWYRRLRRLGLRQGLYYAWKAYRVSDEELVKRRNEFFLRKQKERVIKPRMNSPLLEAYARHLEKVEKQEQLQMQEGLRAKRLEKSLIDLKSYFYYRIYGFGPQQPSFIDKKALSLSAVFNIISDVLNKDIDLSEFRFVKIMLFGDRQLHKRKVCLANRIIIHPRAAEIVDFLDAYGHYECIAEVLKKFPLEKVTEVLLQRKLDNLFKTREEWKRDRKKEIVTDGLLMKIGMYVKKRGDDEEIIEKLENVVERLERKSSYVMQTGWVNKKEYSTYKKK